MAFVDGQDVFATDLNDFSVTSVTTSGDITSGGELYERGRSAAIGDWTDVAHDAGNFTASAGTWTVASGDQTTFAYSIVGKSLVVTFSLFTTSVSTTPAELRIAIPGSYTAAKVAYAPVLIVDNGTRTMGTARTAAAGSTIVIEREDAGNFTASTNNTAVVGQIVIPVS